MVQQSYNVSASKEWQKRNTLAIIGFFGMALMYSLRFCLAIGIVAMVHEKKNNTGNYSICPALINGRNGGGGDNASFFEDDEAEDNFMTQGANDHFTKFQWDEKDQGLVLGSFFWGYILSQFPGGFVAQRYGAKWVVSLGLLVTGILSLILPMAATYGGIYLTLAIRVLQGMGEGVIIPAFAVLIGKWTPPGERGGTATLVFSGMPCGTALTMIASGHLIYNFGWPAVFYAPGILTLVWFLVWSYFVYSSPSEHPTISKAELKYITESIQETYGEDDGHNVRLTEIPWRDIVRSVPVWAILISHFANTWGHNTLKADGSKFLNSVLHFDIHENAYIAAAPYVLQFLICNLVNRFSDYLISRKVITLSAARRLCNSIGQWGTSLAYLSLILAGCNRTLAIMCFIFSGSLNGAVYGGFLINPIDISPNYAGVLEGLLNGLSNLAGFSAPYVAGHILHRNPTLQGWHYVFLIPAIGEFLGNLFFVLFCSTEVQPWNKSRTESKDVETHHHNKEES